MTQGTLEIRLFGRPELRYGGRAIGIDVPPKTYALLAYVLLDRRRRVERSSIAFALWPDEPEERALANVRRYLYRLTKVLLPSGGQSSWLTATTRTIAWNADAPARLDVDDFETATGGIVDVDALLGLYRGDLMQSYDEAWLTAHRAYYRDAFAAAGHAALGRRDVDARTAISLVGRLIAHDPLDEVAVRASLRLHAESGDRIGALREFEDFRRVASLEYGVEPSRETRDVQERIVAELADRFNIKRDDRLATFPRMATRLFGRDGERSTVGELLTRHRLVSLLGIGGIGKTRLGIDIVSSTIDLFPGGAAFVDVARAERSERLLPMLAASLGLSVAGETIDIENRLVAALQAERRIVMLDNCERLPVAVTELLARLVPVTGDSRFVVATRERLDLPEQIVHRVSPLDRASAAALFDERASRSDTAKLGRTFDPSLVDAIVERLDGIPLAIELAATRAAGFELSDLTSRLMQTISIRGHRRGRPPHRKTMGVVLDWSYAYLDADSARIFRHLSIFVGGWTLARARKFFASDDEAVVAAALEQIVDAALVIGDASSEPVRYRFLEPVRSYAAALLQEAGESAEASRRHAETMLEAAERFCEARERQSMRTRVDRAAAEVDDVRAALRWALADGNDVALGRRLAAASEYFLYVDPDEGRRHLHRALQTLDRTAPSLVGARLCDALAMHAISSKRYAEAYEFANRAIELSRTLEHDFQLCVALAHGLFAAVGVRALDEAHAFAVECISIARTNGYRFCESQAEEYLPVIVSERGDYDGARALFAALLEDRRVRTLANAVACRTNFAENEFLAGRYDEAVRLSEEAIEIGERRGERPAVLLARANLCIYLCATGAFADAREQALRTIREARSAGLRALVAIALETLAEIAERHDRIAEAAAIDRYVTRQSAACGFVRVGAVEKQALAFERRLSERLGANDARSAEYLAASWSDSVAVDFALAATRDKRSVEESPSELTRR